MIGFSALFRTSKKRFMSFTPCTLRTHSAAVLVYVVCSPVCLASEILQWSNDSGSLRCITVSMAVMVARCSQNKCTTRLVWWSVRVWMVVRPSVPHGGPSGYDGTGGLLTMLVMNDGDGDDNMITLRSRFPLLRKNLAQGNSVCFGSSIPTWR